METQNEAPKDMYVKLISSDDHEFYVKRDLALTSQTIKAMLSGPGELFSFCNFKMSQCSSFFCN